MSRPIQQFSTKEFNIPPEGQSIKIVKSTDYINCQICQGNELPSPPILEINVYSNPPNLCYQVVFIYKDKNITVNFNPVKNSGPIEIMSNTIQRIITLTENNNSLYPTGDIGGQPYVAGDKYEIKFGFTDGLPVFYVIFSRYKTNPPVFINSTGNFSSSSSLNLISVPAITIKGQTLVDDSDVGNMIFEIIDKYQYYKSKAKKNQSACQLDYITQNEIKLTIFDQCCPKIVSVVKGKAETLRSKLYNLYINWEFRDNIYF